MIPLELVTNNEDEQRIKDYLETNVSQELANKINNGAPTEKDGKPLTNKKTLSGFLYYACKLAKEKARKGATYAMVSDETVFGWSIHYFEEDDIIEKLYTLDGSEYVPEKKVATSKPTPKPIVSSPKKETQQATLFDMFEEEAEDEQSEEDEETLETEEPTEELEGPKLTRKASPLYERYLQLQEEHRDYIIGYRLGDFYEIFGDDAIDVAGYLELTLTSRDVGLDERVPMVGFPFHVRELYAQRISKYKPFALIEYDGASVYFIDGKAVDTETGEVEDDFNEFEKFLFSKINNLVALR